MIQTYGCVRLRWKFSKQCLQGGKCCNITSCVCLHARLLLTLSLIFTEPPGSSADSTQMMVFSRGLKGRKGSATQSSTLPHILQEHFQSASAVLKCADKGELCCHKFSNIPQLLPSMYSLISVSWNRALEGKKKKRVVELKSRAKAQMSLGLNTWVPRRHL